MSYEGEPIGMSDFSIRIERLQNGFEVTMRDPDIVKANNAASNKSGPCPYKDPNLEYAFTTSKEVLDFVKANIDKALPDDAYSDAFDLAAEED